MLTRIIAQRLTEMWGQNVIVENRASGVQPGDVVAVSATNLAEIYVEPETRPLMALLRARQPIGQVGYSILVYRADFSWP